MIISGTGRHAWSVIISALLYVFLLGSIPLEGIANSAGKENIGKKRIEATRTMVPPRIDGILDEEIWSSSPVARDFIVYIPDNGNVSRQNTEVHIVYDDVALYVGAFMFDTNPDSIYIELGERDADRLLNADNFSVEICPYNDGINGFRFKVSASGVQSDSRIELIDFGMMGGGSDGAGGSGGRMMGGGASRGGGGTSGGGGRGRQDNWDAVWESKVSLNDKGWVAEIKIPYSALRFPKEQVQTWGINFWREIKRTREQSSWNFVDRSIGSTINHLGEMYNITDLVGRSFNIVPTSAKYGDGVEDAVIWLIDKIKESK